MKLLDPVNVVLKWMDHNRYTSLAIVLLLLTGVQVGCGITTSSVVDGRQVNPGTFVAEVVDGDAALEAERVDLLAAIEKYNVRATTFNQRVDAGMAELDSKKERVMALATLAKDLIVTYTGVSEELANKVTAPVNAWLLSFAGLGTAGLVYMDNRRKDKLIKK